MTLNLCVVKMSSFQNIFNCMGNLISRALFETENPPTLCKRNSSRDSSCSSLKLSCKRL